jgi:hypothetical protein
MSNPSDWKLRDWPGHDFGQYAGQTIYVEIVLINNNLPDTVTTIYIDDVFFSE